MKARVSTFSVSLLYSLKIELEDFAKKQRKKISDIMNEAVREYLAKRRPKEEVLNEKCS